MVEGFEAYHVPQQSRRDKLRILPQHHRPYDLLHYDPSLLIPPAELSNRLVKEEPSSNLLRFIGDSPYTQHFYTPTPSDPQPSSSSANPNSIQEDNPAFLCTQHDLGNFSRPDHPSYGAVDSAVLANNAQGLSLSLWSRMNSQVNDDRRNLHLPLELNLDGYGSALEYDDRGGRCFSEVLIGPLGPFTGYSSVLRGSRFLKPAQQLLEKLCNAGWGVFTAQGVSESDSSLVEGGGEGFGDADDHCGAGGEKKSRLKSMLDEVCRSYKQYYQQLQNVVASFECVAGLGNAAPYFNLALKVMSKHFRFLKDAIMDQFQFMMKAVRNTRVDVPQFENDERPHLGLCGIQNSGFVENQPVWRPQRGLPERAVTVLRAWLFEHFLHPYPTDNDKLMLAEETGLSRSQVSNWFINARVRLWKPMVEEIHMLETQQMTKSSQAQHRDERNVTQTSNNQFQLSNSLPSTSTPRLHDTLAMRTVGELAAGGSTLRNEQTHNLAHMVSKGIGRVKTSSATLTLGLHHQNNNGMSTTTALPVGAVQRGFGLGHERGDEGCVMGGGGGGYGTQERHFRRDAYVGDVQLVRNFWG